MNMPDSYEADELRAEDAFRRKLNQRICANPNPRDPEHPIPEWAGEEDEQ